MTKALISIAIVAVLALGGWKLFQVWNKYDQSKDLSQQQQAALGSVIPEQLAGMPNGWEEAYDKANDAAKAGDLTMLQAWLKAYGQQVGDPRRAWIEMDYMVMISRRTRRRPS